MLEEATRIYKDVDLGEADWRYELSYLKLYASYVVKPVRQRVQVPAENDMGSDHALLSAVTVLERDGWYVSVIYLLL